MVGRPKIDVVKWYPRKTLWAVKIGGRRLHLRDKKMCLMSFIIFQLFNFEDPKKIYHLVGFQLSGRFKQNGEKMA